LLHFHYGDLFFIIEILYDEVAQFLRGYFCPSLDGVKFGIFVPPLVVFVLGYLAIFEFSRLFVPSTENIKHRKVGRPLELIQPQTAETQKYKQLYIKEQNTTSALISEASHQKSEAKRWEGNYNNLYRQHVQLKRSKGLAIE